MSPAPILLVGAAGQLGQSLAPRLRRLGAVVEAVRADADLERPAELRELVRRVRPRMVVNAAAYTAVDEAEGDAERCARVNVDAPAVLAEESARVGATFVHYSTNYVFDGRAAGAYREEAPTSPLNVYGRTKRLGELAVAAANPAHLVIRTAGVYGWNGRNFLLRILALAREREELQVVDDQLVAPTAASSVADATVAALGQLSVCASAESFGTFHVTAAGATSWFGFAERILALDPERHTQRAHRLVAVCSPGRSAADRPPNGVLDSGKFATRFGFVIPPWDVELARVCREYANR